MNQNKHRREPQEPVNTSDDNQMIKAGLRQPLVDKLPREVFATSKEHKQLVKQLAKQQPLENKVMRSNKF